LWSFHRKIIAFPRVKKYEIRRKTYGIPEAYFFSVAIRIPLIPPIPPVLGISYLVIDGGSVSQNYVPSTSQNKNLSPWVFAGAKVRG
jgi:hypothetical protein